jgi:DNA-binding response OmpR family regulator
MECILMTALLNESPNNERKTKILLIEDDQRLAQSITIFFTSQGFDVKHFINDECLNSLIENEKIDIILCDIMLPGNDGFRIIKRIRAFYHGPYIFMSALNDLKNQLKGFKLGADDYICKPVDPQLLLAKVKACLHRTQTAEQDDVLTVGNLTIDKNNRWARFEQQEISLSRHEFDLLWLLAVNYGKQISREYLFVNTLKRSYDGVDRTIDGRVSRLRKKLLGYDRLSCRINTMWGQGYMLTVNE